MRIKRGPRPILLFLFCFGSLFFFFYRYLLLFSFLWSSLFLCLFCFPSCNSLAADPAGTSRPYKQATYHLGCGYPSGRAILPSCNSGFRYEVQITHTTLSGRCQAQDTPHTALCPVQARSHAQLMLCHGSTRSHSHPLADAGLGCSSCPFSPTAYKHSAVSC